MEDAIYAFIASFCAGAIIVGVAIGIVHYLRRKDGW